jgi:DNA-binding CsgD family transcriptional regulator/PAS domain-containing protein
MLTEYVRRDIASMAMNENEYLKFLCEINEAALAPERWLNVVQMLAGFTGSVAGGLTIEDPKSGTGAPITDFGFDPDHVARTWDHYLPMNPLFKIAPMMRPGAIVTNGMVIDTAAFRMTEFYNGWARPQGICCPITLVLHRSGSAYVPLTLVRPDGTGDADDDVRDLLTRVAPALMKAFSVTMRLERLKSREAALEEALSKLSAGIVLLDRNRHIQFANEAAEEILRDGTMLTAARGLLRANVERDGNLQAAVSAALSGAGTSQANEVLLIKDGVRPILLSVLPVNPASSLFEDKRNVGCVVIISVVDQRSVSGSSRLSKAYNLTGAEARLLEALLAGKDLGEAATSLSVSRNTAATHLRHIFSKTQVNRQSELIRLACMMTAAVKSTAYEAL